MKLIINGEEKSFDTALTLASLIAQMGMKPDRVAAELNREIVPRSDWPDTQLSDGDRLEIVQFVGGGTKISGRAALAVRVGADRV